MSIKFLNIKQLRNLQPLGLAPVDSINVFVGENGSGKTSVLEAIHVLSTGRSFRTHLIRKVITHQSNVLAVFAQIKFQENLIPVGIEKQNSGETRIKISGKSIVNIAELAALLPLQLINQDSLLLLSEGPKIRRQFIDWGLFHVEPKFFPLWRKYSEALKQRNIALKNRADISEVKAWTKVLCPLAVQMNDYRKNYLMQLETYLAPILKSLLGNFSIDLHYNAGWNTEKNLETLLNESIQMDYSLGYTHIGSHRADLLIKVNNFLVQDVLSRGQKKLLIVALKVAQNVLLEELSKKQAIYLIDDLPSELDKISLEKISDLLKAQKSQIFLTSINENQIETLVASNNSQLFHVKQGMVEALV